MLLLVAGSLVAWQSWALWPPTPLDALKVFTQLSLGGWLLTTHRSNLAHVTAVGTYATLTSVAAWGWLQGDLSCGCFGPLDVSPRVTVVLDAVILTFLLSARPRNRTFKDELTDIVWLRRFLVFAALFFIGIFVRHELAETSAAVSIPSTIQVPSGPAGSQVELVIPLANTGPVPVSVVGGGTSCKCMTLTDIPSKISPLSELPMKIRIVRPISPGRMQERVVYYLDAPDQYSLSATVIGEVTDAQPNPHGDY